MKFLSNAFFGASVLSVQSIAGENPDYFNCKSICTQEVNAALATTCDPLRQKLPRPAAHNACLDGYKAGERLACPSECDAGDPVSFRQGKKNACKEWKAKRDPTIVEACENGFKAALNIARESVSLLIDPVVIAQKEQEKKMALEQQQAKAEAKAKAAEAEAKVKAAEAEAKAAEAEAKAAEAEAKAKAAEVEAKAKAAEVEAKAKAAEAKANAEVEDARVSAAELEQAREHARQAYEKENDDL